MYFLKRLIFAVPLLLIISVLAFVLVRVAPGGPFDRARSPASPEVKRQLEAKYHLNEPIAKQYLRYLGLVWEKDAQGQWHHAPASWDTSLIYRNHTVSDIVTEALPVSILLGTLAFGFAMGVGIPLGFWTAARRGRWQEHAGSLFAVLAVCIPGLIVAPLLIIGLGIKSHLLPVALWASPLHAILPTMALGLFFAGKIARLLREGMLNSMQADFVTAARAKGMGETRLLLRHVFPLAVLPVVSYSGPMLADLLTGSFVIETVFQIPGIGAYFVNSSLNRDFTMTVSLALLYAALLIGLNLLVDFIYTLLDPRVKYE